MRRITRREALTIMGGAILGLGVAGSGVMGFITPRSSETSQSTQSIEVPELPWPYIKLDPREVGQRGYELYYEGHCMYGAFEAIIGSLREKVGYPYTLFPSKLMEYGKGGIYGWGTICGALNGAAAAIELVSPDPGPIIDELFNWYQEAELPSLGGQYKPENPKYDLTGLDSVAGSVLCHVSVTKWVEKTGYRAYSPQRSERCAWLTGVVAKYTVELLNEQANGTFKPKHTIKPVIQHCIWCHGKGGLLENTKLKMDCNSCHNL